MVDLTGVTPDLAEVFVDWYSARGYKRAIDACPTDGGKYVGADLDAYDVFQEFREAHPEVEDREDWEEEGGVLRDRLEADGPFTSLFGQDEDEDEEE